MLDLPQGKCARRSRFQVRVGGDTLLSFSANEAEGPAWDSAGILAPVVA